MWSHRSVGWLLLLFVAIVWFGPLGARTLVPTDEGRYAEMAREMLATGDWITTRLNGIKYFEKPPLQIWMTALAFKLFGLGEWQARLWTALSGFAGILLTGYAAARVFGRDIGIMAAAVLASCAFWGVGGHISSLDMSLAGGMTLALCSLLLAQTAANAGLRARWMLACWAGMALAVMSKGLIGIALPGLVLLVYSIATRDLIIWKRLHITSGMMLFASLTLPWFTVVSMRNPEFPHFFFVHEHFQRFTSDVHRREGPWHYFIPYLLVGILPWIGVFVQAIWRALGWRSRTAPGTDNVASGNAATGITSFHPEKLLLAWSVVIFAFFSVSGSKLPAYILPIFPALAILIGAYLRQAQRRQWWFVGASAALLGMMMLILAPQLTGFAADATQVANYQASKPWLAGAGVLMLAGAVPVLYWCVRKRVDFAVSGTLVLAGASLVAMQVLLLGTEPHGRMRSGLPLVPAITAELTPQTPLYAVGLYDQTLPFYLQRTMTLVLHPDELEFGLRQEPSLWKPTLHDFVEPWRSGPKAVAVMRVDIYEGLRDFGVPMREVARKGRQIVVVNR
ncbi:MAG: glycosyltransferase family 39 protein [Pseudomonadota bacterium]